MKCKYFDAHTHVHFPAYGNEKDAAVNRALRMGVGMITVGTQLDTSENAIQLAHKHEGVWATIGLHPGHTAEVFHDADELGVAAEETMAPEELFDYDAYKKLAEDPKVVAIGECGLDYFRLEGDHVAARRKQREALLGQMQLSRTVEKPLMIHCRDAFSDLIATFQTNRDFLNPSSPGVIHFFTGTHADARALLDLGFVFTFGGVITYPAKKGKTTPYRDIVEMLPMEAILSETDAPWVAPVPYRGKQNEPAYVVEVAKKLAEIKNVSEEAMCEVILNNAERVFGIRIK